MAPQGAALAPRRAAVLKHGPSDPRGQMRGGGHLTPGVDPYREVSRTRPVEGAGSLPAPLGHTPAEHPSRGLGPVGPAGLGWPPLRSLQGDFVLQALRYGGPPWGLRPSVVGQTYPHRRRPGWPRFSTAALRGARAAPWGAMRAREVC